MVELGSHAATERVAMVTLRLTCVARPDSIPTNAAGANRELAAQ